MGISYRYRHHELIQRVCREQQRVLPGLKMAELGNQRIRADLLGVEVSAKKVFEFLGVEHTSFDRNGKDGAIPLDFGDPIPAKHIGRYDLVTNFGCVEHIDTDQYVAWMNLHNLCKVGGVMLHQLPEHGSWRDHCPYHYTVGRIQLFADRCGYGLHALTQFEGPRRGDDRRGVILFYLVMRPGSRFIPQPDEFHRIMFG